MSFSGIMNTLRSISHPDVVVDVLPATPLGAPVVHTPTVAPAQVNPPASSTADADDTEMPATSRELTRMLLSAFGSHMDMASEKISFLFRKLWCS